MDGEVLSSLEKALAGVQRLTGVQLPKRPEAEVVEMTEATESGLPAQNTTVGSADALFN